MRTITSSPAGGGRAGDPRPPLPRLRPPDDCAPSRSSSTRACGRTASRASTRRRSRQLARPPLGPGPCGRPPVRRGGRPVVAYAEGGWEQDNDGGRNYAVWGEVHPEWRRRGLGTALLRRTRRHQRAGSPPSTRPGREAPGELGLRGRGRAARPARGARLRGRALRLRDGAPEPGRHPAEMPLPAGNRAAAGRARGASAASGRPRSRCSVTTGARSTIRRRASSASSDRSAAST